jgi:predicted DNA-binding transcriptional regulator YafY
MSTAKAEANRTIAECLAWRLFSWGDNIEIVDPLVLKQIMVEQLRAALKAHGAHPTATR